ncbi:DUF3099 domain-containing protein [Nocardia thailandica]|uniref:DUF3099 domain-containing protein n=1 Tax=Nocardia thailandica TaxID=257275 RepID=A0ABW6PQ74_9NOCA|nr:DUF3099 domain-containing protein [Nocardia thailandica]
MQSHGEPPADDRSDATAGDAADAGSETRPPRPEVLPPTAQAGYFPGSDRRHPALITEAAPSLEDQHRARVRRYTIIMAFRIPCLILAALAYSAFASPLLSILIIAASIPLPWIAVLIANDRPPRRKDEPSRWDGRRNQIALESRGHNALE